jgi:hypothetical protein
MQGLNLIHTGFLAAGLAIALPIVIHLLFRQRTRTVPIGSVRFLHQVVREHRRRRRVRQWLLLSLRMLAVLLLALLFARPYWDQAHQLGLQQEIVLLLDRSASMQARDSRHESSFERGISAVKDELSNLDDNVIVHVAAFDATGVEELPVEQFSNLVASQIATDYGLALSWAVDILAGSNRGTRRIVLITDLQRSGLRSPVSRIPEGVELVIRDVADPLPRNVAIESAQALRTEIRPDSQVSVRAVLRNHGPLAVRKLQVTCNVEGGTRNPIRLERAVDLPGNGNAVVDFPLPIDMDGLYRGSVAIDLDDALMIDNTRWLAFEARRPDRVLLVDGDEGRSIFSSETYYLETALRLQTEEAGGHVRSFEADRIAWESGEGFPRLDGYRAVILANVRRLSETDGERMDSYIRDGGSLLIFAGDQVDPASLAPLRKRGLLPGALADSPVNGPLRVDRWDASHLALACFSDPQQGDLRRVTFHKALPMTSLDPGATELLAAGGQIVVAERSAGKGRCLYFGCTADRDWTDLPRTPMYVPLMRQLLAWQTQQLTERSAVTSQLVDKRQLTAGVAAIAGDEGRWMVTNVDPRESALDRVTPEEFGQLAGATSQMAFAEKNADSLTLPADSLRPDEIWTIIAWFLLAVLAAETLLAGRVHA